MGVSRHHLGQLSLAKGVTDCTIRMLCRGRWCREIAQVEGLGEGGVVVDVQVLCSNGVARRSQGRES